MIKIKSVNFIIVLVTILLLCQKVAFHISGFEFSVAIFLMPVLSLNYLSRKQLHLNTNRFILFLIMIFFMSLLTLYNDNNSNIPSLLLFIYIYIWFCFDLDTDNNEKEKIYNCVRTVIFFSAVIGVVQFIGQLLGFPYFDIFDLISNQVKLSGFNTYYPISYGSRIIKSNGWIYLEPSFFSQFMAMGIVLEMNNKKFDKNSIIHIVTYSLALLVSFSGTGMILLGISLVPMLKKISLKNRIILILALIIGLFAFSQTEFFYAISSRVFEYRASGSSGAIRFVNPYIVAFNNNNFFLGNGAGAADRIVYSFEVNHNAITKVMIEYGFVCLLLFITYVISSFCKKGISTFIVCLLVMYFFLAGNLLQPSITFLLFFLKEIDTPFSNNERNVIKVT